MQPFLHKKNHYFSKEFLDKIIVFTLFVLSRALNKTTSLNIGGTNAWAVPPPQILAGTVPPRSPPLVGGVVWYCAEVWFSLPQWISLLHRTSQANLHCRLA